MHVIAVEFRIRTRHESEFMAREREQSENSLSRDPGCRQFDICSDPADAGRIFLYEVYSDEAALREHLESAHFKDFDAATAPRVESKTVAPWHRHD